jgi:hypothetical protein
VEEAAVVEELVGVLVAVEIEIIGGGKVDEGVVFAFGQRQRPDMGLEGIELPAGFLPGKKDAEGYFGHSGSYDRRIAGGAEKRGK